MDIRNPMLHFPRSLYKYVTHKLKRKIIGIFNKVDLVSEFTVFAWRKYFEEEFPNLRIATFSCFPRDPNLIDDTATCKHELFVWKAFNSPLYFRCSQDSDEEA